MVMSSPAGRQTPCTVSWVFVTGECWLPPAGMLQWGNVLFCQGKRAIDKAAAAGRDVAEVAAEAEAGFAEAEAKYRESRRIKEDFYDAYVSLGNLEFERAKLALGLAVPPPRCVCNPESYLDPLGFHLCTALPVPPTAVPACVSQAPDAALHVPRHMSHGNMCCAFFPQLASQWSVSPKEVGPIEHQLHIAELQVRMRMAWGSVEAVMEST